MKKCALLLTLTLLLLLATTTLCAAAGDDDNALMAIALYIDTSGHYVPGIDLLNKALNEVIRFKVNALFLGSEVQCGNEVIRDLGRNGITNTGSATPENLAAYAQNRHVNYIVLFTVHPLDVSLEAKAYSAAANDFVVDKAVTRPDGSEAVSTLDALSGMLGNEMSQLVNIIPH